MKLLCAGAFFLTLGCSRAPIEREVQSVTALDGGRYWAAGSGGEALYYDGHALHSAPYPVDPGKPDWAYDRDSMFPAAKVILAAGRTILITRGGDVFARGSVAPGTSWRRVRVDFAGREELAQVDHVLPLSGGRVLIHVHSDRFLEATLAELESGAFREQRAPTFLTHVESAGGRVYGIGWDVRSGSRRTAYERSPDGGWKELGELDDAGARADLRGLVVLEPGRPIGVGGEGVFGLQGDRWVAEISGWKLRRALPLLIEGGFVLERGRALLALADGLVELGEGGVSFWQCPDAGRVAGAFAVDGEVRVVNRQGRATSLAEPSCRRESAVPALQMAE